MFYVTCLRGCCRCKNNEPQTTCFVLLPPPLGILKASCNSLLESSVITSYPFRLHVKQRRRPRRRDSLACSKDPKIGALMTTAAGLLPFFFVSAGRRACQSSPSSALHREVLCGLWLGKSLYVLHASCLPISRPVCPSGGLPARHGGAPLSFFVVFFSSPHFLPPPAAI